MVRRAVAVVIAALGLCALSSRKGAAQPAQIAPMPSSSVKVNEDPAAPLGKPSKLLPGWSALWSELPKNTAELRIALAEIDRAEAATRIAWGAVLPTINANGILTYSSRPSISGGVVANGWIAQAQLSAVQSLINLRAWHQIGTQYALEEIANLETNEVRRRLGLQLARSAAAISAATRIAENNRVSLDLAIERLVLTRKRLAAGLGDMRDLVRAQQDVATARSLIAPADESLLQAEEAMAVILGTTGSVGLSIDLDALEAQVKSFCGNGGVSEKERLDVIIAKKRIAIAERNVDDITLKFFPTLTASATAGTNGRAFDGPFLPLWSVSATLSFPIFDGGVRYGERRDRIALVEQAKARALQTQVASLVERAQARRALDVAVASQTSAREARDLAAEADRLAKAAYASGIGTNFDLIDAGRRLRDAETQLVLRDLDVARARLALPFVEGTCSGVVAKG